MTRIYRGNLAKHIDLHPGVIAFREAGAIRHLETHCGGDLINQVLEVWRTDALALYSAADVIVVPSRQDNLPNTGVEAHACATPVIAFRTGGLSDIVEHQRTGYLAKAFDTEDFAEGVRWVMQYKPADTLRLAARQYAADRFSPAVVVPQYLEVYRQAMEMQRL